MVTPSELVFLAFNSLTLSMVLLLISTGLSLIFGLMGVLNFAHGALFAIGSYVGLTLVEAQYPFVVAILVAPFVVAGLGVLIEVFTIRPLYGRDPVYQLLLTFGVALILDELIIQIWGPNGKLFPTPEFFVGTFSFGSIIFPHYRTFIIAAGILTAVAVYLFLERTDLGMVVRAGTMDSDMVQAQGINVRRAFTTLFAVGTALAAFGGVVSGPFLSTYPALGTEILIDAFIVVVIGGLGSFRGAVAGALIVGVVQTFGQYFVPSLAPFLVFLLMAGMLLVRPEGLFGHEVVGGADH